MHSRPAAAGEATGSALAVSPDISVAQLAIAEHERAATADGTACAKTTRCLTDFLERELLSYLRSGAWLMSARRDDRELRPFPRAHAGRASRVLENRAPGLHTDPPIGWVRGAPPRHLDRLPQQRRKCARNAAAATRRVGRQDGHSRRWAGRTAQAAPHSPIAPSGRASQNKRGLRWGGGVEEGGGGRGSSAGRPSGHPR
eukprot:scaffold65962_cov25-Tisochrysis_lutea.AAC.4